MAIERLFVGVSYRVQLAATTVSMLLLAPSASFAHETAGTAGGFVSGFLHPLFGWDHVAAMVAVGLWGAFLGAPAIWSLPIVFPLVMAVGGAIGIAGVALPAVELGIEASALLLGLLIALAARPPLWTAAIIVGAFAIFHGHAHGSELPGQADALVYVIGFVLATGLLHLAGIGFGLAVKWDLGRIAVRSAGGLVALAGAAFLTGIT